METKRCNTVIIGAGLSGLATAHFLLKDNPSLDLLLLEKSDRFGGAIQSHQENGFLAEWGAHGFLDNVAESRELLNDLNAEDSIQRASLKQFKRYICLKGKLQQIPQSPGTIIRSPLMSLPEKMRVLGDLWKKPRFAEQTVAEWAAYRFGKAILPFADIAITGTYAGDIEKLSIDAAMPGLRRLEKEYGSVFRGAIKSRKSSPSTGMPSMVSFKRGMEELVTRLASGKAILTGTEVKSLKQNDSFWQVTTDSLVIEATNLVVATGINAALPLLSDLQKPPKQSVTEAVVNNVVLGFDHQAEIPFGFGYLAPKSEGRFALGTLFSIHMFPGRAPEGHNLVEVLIGGTRHPEYLHQEDSDLIANALADIKQLIKLPDKPLFSKVIRPQYGIPQLELGHLDLLRYRSDVQRTFERLFIGGFGWDGIGINDMIKQARKMADDIHRGNVAPDDPARVKGVYF